MTGRRDVRVAPVAVLLFLSGFCGLVFQVCWFREFRLVFGATTAASSAVLAVFMAGLGLGNLLLGRFADRVRRPLALYAALEAGIAVTVALSPVAVDFFRGVFIATGGQSSLGMPLATAVRLGMAAAVLAVPTFLMGGTLPAAACAVTRPADRSRRGAAWLYGCNTLGAVAGTLGATFFLLERLGNRGTLWLACVLAVLVALMALWLARGTAASPETGVEVETPAASGAPGGLVCFAAAAAGFAFFVMELVWYRMLGPILGGTTFTFGLILAVALAGIGLGAAVYPLVVRNRPVTLGMLSMTSLLGAVCLAAPLAAGDRLALMAGYLREANAAGFHGGVLGWLAVAAIVVFPAALVSGVQFPMFAALLGQGRAKVGRQVGLAFMWNTAGAITGALAGGFGLLPMLSAPGAWRAMIVLSVVTGGVILLFACRGVPRPGIVPRAFAAALALAAVAMLFTEGPTAVWRHSGIGGARSGDISRLNANGLKDWKHSIRRGIIWEADGREAGVGIANANSLAFHVNGRCDGNTVQDAGTQIMLALIGAALHPEPRSAFVVGLGTGETAGWLAEVGSMERVDVAELEPVIAEMARRSAAVNHDVMAHPKVRMTYNDAREVLLTTKERYDLIACEPSNPYRPGIANLFTREFYGAAKGRLNPGGIFMQHLQAYEVDERTVRTVLATASSVFPHVEVWQAEPDDLCLLASDAAPAVTAAELRARMAQEPMVSALAAGWRTTGAEGFLSHYVGGSGMVAAFLDTEGSAINTDDRNDVEYGFARTLGRYGLFGATQLREVAMQADDGERAVPSDGPEAINRETLARFREWNLVMGRAGTAGGATYSDPVVSEFAARDKEGMVAAWEANDPDGSCPEEWFLVGLVYAERGDARALPLIEKARPHFPDDADALAARLAWEQGDHQNAVELLKRVFAGQRLRPWMSQMLRDDAFGLAVAAAKENPAVASELLKELTAPFAVDVAREGRLMCASLVAGEAGPKAASAILEQYEPHIPWLRNFLEFRSRIYSQAGHRLAAQAARDMEEFEFNK